MTVEPHPQPDQKYITTERQLWRIECDDYPLLVVHEIRNHPLPDKLKELTDWIKDFKGCGDLTPVSKR